ncbi:MAG: transcription elongation factor GreA [Patescibacteria group bacterium]|nr:transcription elongation factor GreA [Patescibacteria group bacterium]
MSSEKELYLSKAGLEDLKTELAGLLEERKEITQRIKDARELGDLSENAEYTAAKNKQSFTEGRIAEIESMLKIATIIDDSNRTNGNVALGSVVKVDVDGDQKEYTVTGSSEARPLEGKISNESPIGLALMGQKKGSTVEVETPDGVKEYRIISIK